MYTHHYKFYIVIIHYTFLFLLLLAINPVLDRHFTGILFLEVFAGIILDGLKKAKQGWTCSASQYSNSVDRNRTFFK